MFDEDLVVGEAAQERVKDTFKKKYAEFRVIPSNEHTKTHDHLIFLLLLGGETSIEVKDDRRSDGRDPEYPPTGNFAIEREAYGNKSGLRTTEAEWWIQCQGHRFFIFRVSTLRRHLRNWTHVPGGDHGTAASLYIVPIETATPWAEHVIKFED